MNKLRIDYLKNHPDYKVVQHEDMYHFNTDTCLLGEYIEIKKNEKVLDVGTNNGALLVYIIKKGGIASGIEIEKDALEICKLTLKENQLEANLIHGDFTTFDSHKAYDVIVSNPPYFDSQDEKEKNDNPYKSKARHEGQLNITSLCYSLAMNLKDTGRIYLIYRISRFQELEVNLNKNGLFIEKFQYVYDYRKKNPKVVLLTANFKKKVKFRQEDIYIGDKF